MKYLFLILILIPFACFSTDKFEPSWVLKRELSIGAIRVYKDANIVTKPDTPHIHAGSLLMTSTDIKLKATATAPVKFKSSVIIYAVDCKTGLFTPAFELVFMDEMPTPKSDPAAMVEFGENMAAIIPKENKLYKVLCPVMM